MDLSLSHVLRGTTLMYASLVASTMPGKDRAETGEYVESVPHDDVLKLLEGMYDPVVTVKDVADALDCSGETARRKLSDLHERGEVKKMQVGANAVVWWLNEDGETNQDENDESDGEEDSERGWSWINDEIDDLDN